MCAVPHVRTNIIIQVDTMGDKRGDKRSVLFVLLSLTICFEGGLNSTGRVSHRQVWGEEMGHKGTMGGGELNSIHGFMVAWLTEHVSVKDVI